MASDSTQKRGSDGTGEMPQSKRPQLDDGHNNNRQYRKVLIEMEESPAVIEGEEIPNDQLSTLLSAVILEDSKQAYSEHLRILAEKGDDELRNLIEAHPDVKTDLQEGWKIKSFHKIRHSSAPNSCSTSCSAG